MIRPWHPFTKAAQQAVPPSDPQEYRIEIYPTSNVFKAGDRIRLTIGTADTPATMPPVPNLAGELGGTLRVLRGPQYPSYVQLPADPGERRLGPTLRARSACAYNGPALPSHAGYA